MDKDPYTTLASYYDALFGWHTERETNFVLEVFKSWDRPIKRILDAACGTGRHAKILQHAGYEVLCLDRSTAMLKVAKRKNLTTIQADIRKMSYAAEFDAVLLLFSSFQYMITNNDAKQALKSIYRALKEKGVFILDIWNAWYKLFHYRNRGEEMAETDDFKVLRITNSEIGLTDQTYQLGEVLLIDKEGKFEMHHNVHQMRLYSPLEIVAFVEAAGFEIKNKYANFNLQERFETSLDPEIMVIVAKK
ncbi:MAG: class I SAM-dependent methyltransferase [Candidatus Heimdallarchaeota archaeon]